MKLNCLTKAQPGTPEWDAAHKGRIGGSAVADILGCGRNTPLRRWAIIKEKIEVEDISSRPYIKLGTKLEPVVCELWEEETARKLESSPGTLVDSEFPWLIGTPDRMIAANGDRPVGIFEAKTTSRFFRSEWEEDVPLPYRVQLAVYLRITDLQWGSFGALVGGGEFLFKDEVRNHVFEDWMMNRLVDFWTKHVEKDIPPDATWAEADQRTIRQMYPRDDGTQIEATPLIYDLTREIDAIQAEADQAKAVADDYANQIEALKNRIKQELGPHTHAVGGDFVWQYKTERRKGYVVADSETRILRRKKAL